MTLYHFQMIDPTGARHDIKSLQLTDIARGLAGNRRRRRRPVAREARSGSPTKPAASSCSSASPPPAACRRATSRPVARPEIRASRREKPRLAEKLGSTRRRSQGKFDPCIAPSPTTFTSPPPRVYAPSAAIRTLNRYFWTYTIEIANHGDIQVQLLERIWRITDANGRVEIGPGPRRRRRDAGHRARRQLQLHVGLRPDHGLRPDVGHLSHGRCQRAQSFDAEIPPFSLDSPMERRVLN